MKKSSVHAIAAAVLSVVAVLPVANATGAVMVSVTTVQPSQASVPLTGYTGYALTLNSDSGVITAVDFGSVANLGGGFFGTFFQRTQLADDGEGNIAATPTATGTSTTNYDSHFLPVAANRLDVAAPSENNNGTNPLGTPVDTSTSDYGTGTFLKGAFGLQNSGIATTLPIVYLVIKDGQQATFSGQVQTLTGGLANISGTVGVVPEPTTLGLLAAGSVGLLARRRKTA